MGRLEGKAALITGGGTGIGRAIALRFATEGARVVIAQRNAEALDATVADIEADGGWARAVPTDITQTDQVLALVDHASRSDRPAGHPGQQRRAHGPRRGVSGRRFGCLARFHRNQSHRAVRDRPGRGASHGVGWRIAGRIINTGSVDSFASEMQAAPYAASKGGLLMLTRSMAIDLGAHGIAVNLLAPGPILVDKNAARYQDPALVAKRTEAIPLGPFGRVEDVAAAALFLASDECQYVTGSAITIDGGTLAKAHF